MQKINLNKPLLDLDDQSILENGNAISLSKSVANLQISSR